MVEKAAFSLKQRNPDVLTSIANLSNDEVFTPPSFANQMLDTIEEAWAKDNDGAIIWEDKDVTFLDPFTKSGVFLREITSRLTRGLEKQIPDAQERVNHILTKQVFGVAITELTALLARRSVYCSKHANGKHSICDEFDTPEGNIWFERTEHTWAGGKEKVITVDDNGNEIENYLDGKCGFCGAPKRLLDRDSDLETYAYGFIHSGDIRLTMDEKFGSDMKFDVVVGNPPYHMTGGGGGSNDSSIYHLFVQQAKALEPRMLTMVIPSRWIAGGRGLDSFRQEMLSDRSIRKFVDFPSAKDAFPGQKIEGGVCYFLWDSSHTGDCEVIMMREGIATRQAPRKLDEFDVLVRDELSLSVLRKTLNKSEDSIVEMVSGDTPFGLPTNFSGRTNSHKKGDLTVHFTKHGKRGVSYLENEAVSKNRQLIDGWKVFVPEAYGIGASPQQVLGKPIVAGPGEICTQSFLVVGLFKDEETAGNFVAYLSSRFFRFLVSLRKISQHALKATYTWAPIQDFSKPWTDAELYAKYKLDQDEIEFIESMIRPVELGDA